MNIADRAAVAVVAAAFCLRPGTRGAARFFRHLTPHASLVTVVVSYSRWLSWIHD